MRFLTFAGLVAGLFVASLLMKKHGERVLRPDRGPDRRYSIDDFIADQDL